MLHDAAQALTFTEKKRRENDWCFSFYLTGGINQLILESISLPYCMAHWVCLIIRECHSTKLSRQILHLSSPFLLYKDLRMYV